MAKCESSRITSCTIFWENTEDISSAVTKVLQGEKYGVSDGAPKNCIRSACAG